MANSSIKSVHARQIMDCRLRPMLEVDIITEDGIRGRGSAPTGVSVGMYETYVMRDGEPTKFNGLGVRKAAEIIEQIVTPQIIGMDVLDQHGFDSKLLAMDGTINKSKLGGNTIYSLSMACARAGAATMQVDLSDYFAQGPILQLPLPTFNSINGGHSERIQIGIQEFTFSPYGAENMEEAIEIAMIVFNKVGKVIANYNKNGFAEMGHSYGWAPPSSDPSVVMALLHEAVTSTGYENKVAYALDCASSSQYNRRTDTYLYNKKQIDSDEMIGRIKELTEKYNFIYIEDILHENDWNGFSKAVKELKRTYVIGDDLIVTNRDRLQKAHEMRASDGFIFKPNQVGTITESLDTVQLAKEHNMLVVPATRGGGMVDDIVMELGIALGAPFVKNSSPRGGERIYSLNCLYRAFDNYPDAKLFDFSTIKRF